MIIAESENALILLVVLIAAISFGVILWLGWGVSLRFTATLTTFGLALCPLIVLFWNTSISILAGYHLFADRYNPKVADFDNPLIVYAAGYAIFHTLADLTTGWRDQIEIARVERSERRSRSRSAKNR